MISIIDNVTDISDEEFAELMESIDSSEVEMTDEWIQAANQWQAQSHHTKRRDIVRIIQEFCRVSVVRIRAEHLAEERRIQLVVLTRMESFTEDENGYTLNLYDDEANVHSYTGDSPVKAIDKAVAVIKASEIITAYNSAVAKDTE